MTGIVATVHAPEKNSHTYNLAFISNNYQCSLVQGCNDITYILWYLSFVLTHFTFWFPQKNVHRHNVSQIVKLTQGLFILVPLNAIIYSYTDPCKSRDEVNKLNVI